MVLVVTVVLVVVVSVVTTVRRPLPDWSGTLEAVGLQDEVTVVRDAQGVPQVYASSAHDLFFAQGVVHAQDRFFEMDFRRHVTAGRLSELVGPSSDALQADEVVRTLGWRRVAERELPLLSDDTREHLQAYADGVNSYVGERSPGELSRGLLGARPDRRGRRHRAVDARRLAGLAEGDGLGPAQQLQRRARSRPGLRPHPHGRRPRGRRRAGREPVPAVPVRARVDRAGHLDLGLGAAGRAAHRTRGDDRRGRRPRVEPDVRVQAAARSGRTALEAAQRALDAVPTMLGRGDGIGSNSWVVAGAHTESGRPLLANDPHLAPGMPSIWYQVGLHCTDVGDECPFDVSGFSFSGMPGVVIGHNADIAWGVTNLGADVTDFYLEDVERGHVPARRAAGRRSRRAPRRSGSRARPTSSSPSARPCTGR